MSSILKLLSLFVAAEMMMYLMSSSESLMFALRRLQCNDFQRSQSQTLLCHSLMKTESTTTTSAGRNISTTFTDKPYAEHITAKASDDEGLSPKLAWLLSFPNSGTSFTTKMVRQLSRMSTASNYGEEYLNLTTGKSMPLYEPSTAGPFWIDPLMPDLEYSRPTVFVLTKNHCGGRCGSCRPTKFITAVDSFFTQCLSGKAAHIGRNGQVIKREVTPYDPHLVKRAVHLIRSPFDNVVSRFHYTLYKAAKHNETEKLARYPNSQEGFRKFCTDRNAKFEEEESSLFDPKVFALIKNLPCRDDFFRFVQWHNYAHLITTRILKVPTMVIHYEDYETKYNETAMELLDFLHLKPKGELIQFVSGKTYHDYYLQEERAEVRKAMEYLSLPSTWKQIAHYFDNYTSDI